MLFNSRLQTLHLHPPYTSFTLSVVLYLPKFMEKDTKQKTLTAL